MSSECDSGHYGAQEAQHNGDRKDSLLYVLLVGLLAGLSRVPRCVLPVEAATEAELSMQRGEVNHPDG